MIVRTIGGWRRIGDFYIETCYASNEKKRK